ncbi:Stp1/IreP family PP2C-type Ser/Thr phosphatase [Acetanaerobacterium elongatum]|uniref:Protein phosphatase n=1 Tax=Acetanaerobacterium elongatum TaxID=258515 RepID=A0A1G9VMT2_9FIRM|nr:Stp1/IreP family PP2C-type Ser/Thr phosphatase [Acetanaerobacterium elongatum]SDM73489.1 protein phosphatase [Acetanaerobacterium elongatum]
MIAIGKTDIGMIRKQNQDSYKYGTLGDGSVWAVVCDGMGGENGGEVASTLAVDSISQSIARGYRSDMTANSVRTMLLSAISAANIRVYDKAMSSELLSRMGTTVVAAVVAGGAAHIAYAGDSRVYLISGNMAEQVTKDHTMVQALVERGEITSDQAKNHPQKHVITRALGVEQGIEIDYCEVQAKEGDVLMICTDGLTNYVEESEMAEIVRRAGPDGCLEALINMANERGGTDNITIVAIFS